VVIMTSCVCFGPNDSYLFNSPKKWSHHNLPPAVTQLFTQEPKIRDVHELALGPNGAYAIIYKDAHGKTMLSRKAASLRSLFGLLNIRAQLTLASQKISENG